MSNLETALRRALAKGDINDPEFRNKIYTAAANALEKAQDVDESTLVARRKNLAAVIAGIETELGAEVPEVEPDTAPTAEQEVHDEPVAVADTQIEPRHDIQHEPVVAAPEPDMPHLRAEPVVEPRPETSETRPAKKKRTKRHPFATLLTALILIALLLAGFMFVWTTGAFQSAEERDTSIPNPSLRLQDESSENAPQRAPALAAEGSAEERAAAEGWITIFTPSDPTTLSLASGAEASIESDPFGDFARLITPTAESAVFIDVPVGTLDELQGGPVQINVFARAEEGQSTEMSVTCDFGPLGDCGRKRFIVGQSPSEYLFRVDLPEVGQVQNAGMIRLRADINDNQRALKLLAVRVRPTGNR